MEHWTLSLRLSVLHDYRNHAASRCGLSDIQLLEVLEQIKSTNLAKYDSVVMDEMYIKDGLVFQKSTDALIGYEDLGDASNLRHDAQNQINHPNKVITTESY